MAFTAAGLAGSYNPALSSFRPGGAGWRTLSEIITESRIGQMGGTAEGLSVVSGKLIPSQPARGLTGLYRNAKVKFTAYVRMGYEGTASYAELIGAYKGRTFKGGVHASSRGIGSSIMLDRYAFDSGYLAQVGLGSYREVLAHEVGHWLNKVKGRPVPFGNLADPSEFSASWYGAQISTLSAAETQRLLTHAYQYR